jgi:hypothetical protein
MRRRRDSARKLIMSEISSTTLLSQAVSKNSALVLPIASLTALVNSPARILMNRNQAHFRLQIFPIIWL